MFLRTDSLLNKPGTSSSDDVIVRHQTALLEAGIVVLVRFTTSQSSCASIPICVSSDVTTRTCVSNVPLCGDRGRIYRHADAAFTA